MGRALDRAEEAHVAEASPARRDNAQSRQSGRAGQRLDEAIDPVDRHRLILGDFQRI